MNEQIFWISLAIMIILCAMAIGAAVVFMRTTKPEDNRNHYEMNLWHVEMWHIRYGYQVDLRFMNTCTMGRAALAQCIVRNHPSQIDPTISREHCMFYEQGGVLLAWNMSAVNPAVINGYRLNQPVQLMPGDRLELGNSVFLVTRVERI